MFTLLCIAATIAVVVWIYVDINAARATARWGVSGIRGVASEINSLKAEVKQKQVEDPNRQDHLVEMLNTNILDLGDYEARARGRSIKSHTELNALIAKHSA